jgi:hypothetical protein
MPSQRLTEDQIAAIQGFEQIFWDLDDMKISVAEGVKRSEGFESLLGASLTLETLVRGCRRARCEARGMRGIPMTRLTAKVHFLAQQPAVRKLAECLEQVDILRVQEILSFDPRRV